MAADITRFLRDKFINNFEVEEKEHPELPLHSYFTDIKNILEDYTITPSTPIQINNWLNNLNTALTDCCILSEELKTQTKKGPLQGYSFSQLWLLRTTKNLLHKIRKNLHLLTRIKLVKPSSSSTLAVAPTQEKASISYRLHGFDEQLKHIEAMLNPCESSPGFKKVAIVGMGGSGKTALARMVFLNWQAQDSFSPTIWISLAETLKGDLDFEQIVMEMLMQCSTGETFEKDVSLEELLFILGSRLEGKKYLIVLDGIWHINRDWWYLKLKEALQWDFKGDESALIITTRVSKVAERMVGKNNLHQMQPIMDRESCWSIFTDAVKEEKLISIRNPILLKMKDDIVDQCDGLPLAAKTLPKIISKHIYQIQ